MHQTSNCPVTPHSFPSLCENFFFLLFDTKPGRFTVLIPLTYLLSNNEIQCSVEDIHVNKGLILDTLNPPDCRHLKKMKCRNQSTFGICVFLCETMLVCFHTVRRECTRCVKLPPSALLDCLWCSDLSLEEDVWQDRNMWVPGEEMESLRPFFF